MSIGRCGICASPVMAGAICGEHADRLAGLLERCVGIESDLDDSIARRRRHGETVSRSSEAPLPINIGAVEASTALHDALHAALAAVLAREGERWPRLTLDASTGALRSLWPALRLSWTAPALLGDLEVLVPRAVAAVDIPRGRLTVRVPCPACGGGPLRPVMGTLECCACGERSTIGAVREVAGAC